MAFCWRHFFLKSICRSTDHTITLHPCTARRTNRTDMNPQTDGAKGGQNDRPSMQEATSASRLAWAAPLRCPAAVGWPVLPENRGRHGASAELDNGWAEQLEGSQWPVLGHVKEEAEAPEKPGFIASSHFACQRLAPALAKARHQCWMGLCLRIYEVTKKKRVCRLACPQLPAHRQQVGWPGKVHSGLLARIICTSANGT